MHNLLQSSPLWNSFKKPIKTFCSFFSSLHSLLQQLEYRLLENRVNQLAKNFKLEASRVSLNPITSSALLQTGFLDM